MSLFTSYTHLTHKPKNTPQGFTIVELLIVIVVIAILAAISVVAYNGVQERARNSARVSEAQEWVKILNMYASTKGSYPFISGSACLGYDFPKYNGSTTGSCWDANTGNTSYEKNDINTDIEEVVQVKLPNYTRAVINEGGRDRLGPVGYVDGGRFYVYYWLESSGSASTASCPVGSKTWAATNSYSCRIAMPTL